MSKEKNIAKYILSNSKYSSAKSTATNVFKTLDDLAISSLYALLKSLLYLILSSNISSTLGSR